MADESPVVLLSPKDYPFTIQGLNRHGEIVWSETVTGPRRLFIPALHLEHGPITIRTRWPDGRVEDTPPPASH